MYQGFSVYKKAGVLLAPGNHLTVTPQGENSQTYNSSLDPKIRENDYRVLKEAFSDFDEIVFYLTEGRCNLKLIVVEHDTPTTSTITYTSGSNNNVNSRPAERTKLMNDYGGDNNADWGFLVYPFENDYYYPLKEAIGGIVTGGMSSYETRPYLLGTIEKILYSRHGSHPLMSSDERKNKCLDKSSNMS